MRYGSYKLIKRVRQLGVFQGSAKTAHPEEKIMLFHEVGFCETTASSHPSKKCPNLLKLGHIFSIFCVFLLIFRDETHLWDTRDGESSCPKIPIFFVEIQAITSALSFPLTYIPSLELNTYAGACIPITTKKLWTELQKCYTQLKDV